jgi:hypothetical protein
MILCIGNKLVLLQGSMASVPMAQVMASPVEHHHVTKDGLAHYDVRCIRRKKKEGA